jgi:endonuclease YncB( thermonuclease family)
MAPIDPTHRYSVSVKRIGDRDHWVWEVQRNPPLGIRLYGENFDSAYAAKADGEKALQSLLKSVANEKPET